MCNAPDFRDTDAFLSCFGPNAWPPEVIHPGLIMRSRINQVDPQQWVNDVVRRVPTWAGGILKLKRHESLEDTCQEFCRVMVEHRPDLGYDERRASKPAFLRAVLLYTHFRLTRKMRTWATLDNVNCTVIASETEDPAFVAEQKDLAELLRRWVGQLPENQRLALDKSADVDQPSRSILDVRRSRAVQHLRSRAHASGLQDRPMTRRSRRYRSVRLPATRILPSPKG